MFSIKLRNTISICTLVFILSACGSAHVRTETHSPDLHTYNNVFIDVVDVHSQEASAKTNKKLQEKMLEWESFARNELETYVDESHYKLVTSPENQKGSILIINLDIDLVYGSRAARYFGGFGAGKGSVDSTLTVSDSTSGITKFRAIAESDLSVGAFGGDMQGVLKDNIRKLVEQYPRQKSE